MWTIKVLKLAYRFGSLLALETLVINNHNEMLTSVMIL